ncbi:MAG: imidazole glycerol phosphate synthase subunit HisH [Candidatus Omnitrophica bacterium]|nr:imidazole glycerol phosphate synthase subunit HisH [Candidatus Omnitrophota bacterium]
MIAIIDYGMGNLRSVQKALEVAGGTASIVSRPEDILKADKLVMPGVGAIRPAMDKLKELGLVESIKTYISSGKPFLGICLGFQLLFESSTEGGDVKGLGILKGTVDRFQGSVKVPQMGWNTIQKTPNGEGMFKDVPEGSFVYFCHSYFVNPQDKSVTATFTDYGIPYTSSICVKNIWGTQFHPEKSQAVGLTILKNFVLL